MGSRRSFLKGLAALPVTVGLSAKSTDSPASTVFGSADIETSDAELFAHLREDLHFPPEVVYCNTGTLGATPREVMAAMVSRLQSTEAALPDWPYFQADGEPLTGYQPLLDARRRIGQLLGASPEEIAITQNATMGMNDLANGLDWQPGDEVLTTDQEHGGAVSIFRLLAKRRGIVVRELPVATVMARGPEAIVDLFRDAVTPRLKVIMVSQVTSQLGIRMPVEALIALAKAHGALSLIDGAQAVGCRDVNLAALGCDAYVASPHKWLMAPKGTGILYVRRDVQSKFWTTLASYQWNNEAAGAFRFMQYGTGSVAVIDGLMAAIALAERHGMARVERWNLALTQRLRAGLANIPGAELSSPSDERLASAITTFRVRGMTARDLQNALWDKKIRVRAQGDDKGVRLSAHRYVSPADIDRVLRVVAEAAASASPEGA
jgi:selenocysteine lyase/cysteine desulfurase